MMITFFLKNQYYNMAVIVSLSIIILRLIYQTFKILISMNLSPSRSPTHPHSQPAHQIKPRVAFTYQINNPSQINNLTQASPIQGSSNNKIQQISGQKPVGSIINGNNGGKSLCTPQKLFEKDKQNAHISQNKRNESKNLTNMESQGYQTSQMHYKIINEKGQQASEVSNFTLNHLKNKQIQSKMALPPLSPKNVGKKSNHQRSKTGNISSQNTVNNLTSRSKCPSFLAHKQKNQELIDQSTNQILNKTSINFGQNKRLSMGENGRFCKCGQFATHKYDIKQICCYKCGITKMFEGHELFPLQTQNKTITIQNPTTRNQEMPQIKPVQPEVEKNPVKVQILNKLVQNQELSISGQKILKQIEQEKKSLTRFYRQSIETQDENIKNFYKERKIELKNHYEKVKLALKASIEQDLLQLELMQKEQMNQWRKSIELMEDDLKKLEKIESKIRESVSIQKKLNKQLFQEYQEVAIKGKYQNKPWRVSKLEGQADTMNLSGISNLTSPNISAVNITLLLKNFHTNGQVYKPQIYRMVGCVIKSQLSSPRPSDLGSQIIQRDCQSPNQVSYIEENHVELQKQNADNYTTPKNHNKNVLFSFEGKKC